MHGVWESAHVRAPLDGTIVKDFIGAEKQVAVNKEIFLIADVSEFNVRARVDELDIKNVLEGQMAEIRLPIFPDRVFRAQVTEVGSAPEGQGTLEIPVVLKITDPAMNQLRPRLTAEARIFTGVTEPVISVPKTAITNSDGKSHVWVLGPLSRLRDRVVTVGRANPERVEIRSGLKPGDRVVRAAEPSFTDGMRVVIGSGNNPGTLELLKKDRMRGAPEGMPGANLRR
jgi:cobalt-zinc-cadmium efflux system membrane fusion protein